MKNERLFPIQPNKLLSSSAVVVLTISALLLAGCSSNEKTIERATLTPLESPYSVIKHWQVTLEGFFNQDSEGLSIAESEGFYYLASESGIVASLYKAPKARWHEQVNWQLKFASPVVSGPTLSGDTLFIGTAKGQLVALEAMNGTILWQTQLSSEVLSAPVVAGDKIFTRTGDGKLVAIERKSGQQIWQVEHQMPSLSLRGAPPVLVDGHRVFIAWETGVVQALSTHSGALQWETRIAMPSGRTDLERMTDIQAKLQLRDGRLLAQGFHGKLVAIHPDNGQFYYEKALSGYRDFVVDGSHVYAMDEQDVLYAFDLYTGANLWRQEALRHRQLTDLVLYDDRTLLVSDGDGYLHWIDRLQGIETARVKHSNDYGLGRHIQTLLVSGSLLTLLDEKGVVTQYEVVPSNLSLFKQRLAN